MHENFEHTSDNSAEQVSKSRSIVRLVLDAMKRVKRRLTPVLVIPANGKSKIMSEHSMDQCVRFIGDVEAARTRISSNPFVNLTHRKPTVEQFKEWKKTGVIKPGVESDPFLKESSSYTDEYSLVQTRTLEDETEIRPAAADDEISPEEAVRRLESDGVVKVAPRLAEQLKNNKEDRSNIVTFITGVDISLGTRTSQGEYKDKRTELTEYEILYSFDEFLAKIETLGHGYPFGYSARLIRENLTFIGEKEYKEAAAGIAASWLAALEADDDLHIYAVTGEIAKLKNSNGKTAYYNQIKSDEYLLDNVLANFTEEDWEKYGGRILVDRDDIMKIPKEHLRVVLLDDWTISGWQLEDVYASLISQYPELKDSIEIQLIVANEQRIKHGLKTSVLNDSENIPVKAYFLAHHSKIAENEAHITGYHSAVDFDFEQTIGYIVHMARSLLGKDAGNIHMPPGTNIVRPYRKDGVTRANLTNIERARQYRKLVTEQGDSRVIL